MPKRENLINKEDLIIRIQKNISEEKKLVGRIMGQIKQSRKKARARLNINQEQLRIDLNQIIKSWTEVRIPKIVDQFLAEIKNSLQKKENILLQGYFGLTIPQNKEKKRIRFRAGSKLKREINPLSHSKNYYCLKHQLIRTEHKISDCCDKSQGLIAYARCFQFQALQKEIRECENCKL